MGARASITGWSPAGGEESQTSKTVGGEVAGTSVGQF